MIKTNFHTHSDFSDGKEPLREYVMEGLRQGLTALGFSEHSPLPFPNNFALHPGAANEYVATVRELQKEFAGRIDLYAGMEFDYVPGLSENFSDKKKQWNLDYVIGSVHLVMNEQKDGLWFIDGPDQSIYDNGIQLLFGNDIQKAVTAYWKQLQRMLLEENLDIIGHLDKIKMHNQGRFFSEDDNWYRDLVKETLDIIASRGLIIEVNTRGIYKKRSPDLFPGPWILTEAFHRNIPVMLSSDAHNPGEITAGLEDAANAIRQAGYTHHAVIKAEGTVLEPLF